MKKIITILLFIPFLFINEAKSQPKFWTVGTAFTVPVKHMEISLFRPTAMGISNRAEISLHPVAFFAMPHFFYKRKWKRMSIFGKNYFLSSRHGLYIPTLALRLVRDLEIRDYLDSTTQIPYTLATQHEIIVSHYVNPPSHCDAGNYLLTARLGFKYAYGIGESTPPIIYQSVLYRETMVFSPKLVSYIGFDLDAHLNTYFNYFIDLDFYSVGAFDNIAVETKMGLMGYSGKKWSMFGGLKTSYSTMPESDKLMFMPIFDITYHLRRKANQGRQKGLFKKRSKFYDTSADGDVDQILDAIDNPKKGKKDDDMSQDDE